MSIEQPNVIDYIATSRETNAVVLSISDHLDWDDFERHCTALEKKLGWYLEFLRSGQIFEEYPTAKDRQIEITLYCKYEPSPEATDYLEAVRLSLADEGLRFSASVVPEPVPPS